MNLKSFRHIRVSATRAAVVAWKRVRAINPKVWFLVCRVQAQLLLVGAVRRLAWLSTVIISRVTPRFVPHLSLTLAASVLYDVSTGTVMRQWTEEAFPKDPDRQFQVFKRALLFGGSPLYGRKPPSRRTQFICDVSHDVRQVIGTNSLVGIDNPTIILYANVSVPITAIWKTARRIRRY